MFSLDQIGSSIISQLGIIVLLIMAWRSIMALARQSFGEMFMNLGLGTLAIIVVFMGPAIQTFGEWVGNSILP